MRLALFAIFFGFLAPVATAEPSNAVMRSKVINSFDLNHVSQTQFGQLRFIGGLVLYSDNKHFGGISALRVEGDDLVTAVTDSGFWYSSRIERHDDGKPRAFAVGRLSPILDETGTPFLDKWSGDAEGLALGKETAFVSAEQFNRVLRFDRKSDLFSSSSTIFVAKFPGPKLEESFGLEAIALIPEGSPQSGALLALSEGSISESGDLRGFILRPGQTDELTIVRSHGYSITDADFLPEGDLLILERRFSLGGGAQVRIRQIDGHTIKAGSKLDGPVIFEANRNQQIDNMEGLSVFTDKDGAVKIALISDNNYWLLQRTIYLEFLYK